MFLYNKKYNHCPKTSFMSREQTNKQIKKIDLKSENTKQYDALV